MPRRALLVLVMGAALLAAPGPAAAQANKLIGTVTSIDADAGTVSVSESHGSRAMDLRFDKKSKFVTRASRQTVKPADIAVGSAVTVLYDEDGSGEPARVRHMSVSPPSAVEEG
jgi:uncharacterized protein (DUF2141 family)